MERRTPAAVFATLIGTILIVPAAAQFGGIFGDPPPRPPTSVPGGRQQIPTQQQPMYPQPPAAYPPPGGGGPPGGGVQSRPLPPPSGGAVGEPWVPAPRQPRGTPQPADTSPQPGDDIITEPPSQRVVNGAALFAGLDKITGRTIKFDVAIGETVQFGALQVTPRTCFTRPTTETQNTDAFIEVEEVTLQGEVRRIFTGWVFAASPGLHAVEHPIYDIWLTDCKSPLVVAEPVAPAPTPAAAPPARNPPAQPKQKQAPKQQPQQQTQGFPPFR